jgi:hypothetical protein
VIGADQHRAQRPTREHPRQVGRVGVHQQQVGGRAGGLQRIDEAGGRAARVDVAARQAAGRQVGQLRADALDAGSQVEPCQLVRLRRAGRRSPSAWSRRIEPEVA